MRQKREHPGQVMPWNELNDLVQLRLQTKSHREISDKQLKLIEEMADEEAQSVVSSFLFGL